MNSMFTFCAQIIVAKCLKLGLRHPNEHNLYHLTERERKNARESLDSGLKTDTDTLTHRNDKMTYWACRSQKV